MKITSHLTGWHIASATIAGIRCMGYGKTATIALMDCLKDYEVSRLTSAAE